MGFFIGASNNLSEIDMSYNVLSLLSNEYLNEITNLESANFSHNSLDAIHENAFAYNPKLMILDLSYNYIEALPKRTFVSNRFLEVLRLHNNPLKHFDCGWLMPVKNLHLIDAPFEHIEKMELNCAKCSMHAHPEDSNELRLRLDTNELRFFKTDLKSVNYLSAGRCQIGNLTEMLQLMSTAMTALDVSHNYLGRLDVDIFSRYTKLQFLLLSHTNLSELQPEVFDHLNRLEMLDVSFNTNLSLADFRSISKTLKNLHELSIAGLQMENTSEILKLLNPLTVSTLDLSKNFMGHLNISTFQPFINLKFLNLSHTNLSNFGFITFYNQDKIHTLDISYNNLENVEFTLTTKTFFDLTTLVLDGNNLKTELETIYPSNFPSLTYLGISKNHFTCPYLKMFINKGPFFKFLGSPWEQIPTINANDCISNENDFSPNNRRIPSLTSHTDSHSVVTCPSLNIPNIEIQIILYLLVFLCIINCGHFVMLAVKSDAILRMKQRLSKKTDDPEFEHSNTENTLA